MKYLHLMFLAITLFAMTFLTGCPDDPVSGQDNGSLVEARRGFKTKLVSSKIEERRSIEENVLKVEVDANT